VTNIAFSAPRTAFRNSTREPIARRFSDCQKVTDRLANPNLQELTL
jgi:hypothetical protein